MIFRRHLNLELAVNDLKMVTPIIVENYDQQWPNRFEVLRAQLAAVLNGFAARIDHVGSTAVPGLAAKPIIDIDVLLKSSSDLPIVIQKLDQSGYEHEGNLGIVGREAFRARQPAFPHHLYVCPPGSREYEKHIVFRDHLRAHASDANAYALLKRKLATKFGCDRAGYAHAKTAFIEGRLK